MYAKYCDRLFKMSLRVDRSMMYIVSPSWYCQFAIPNCRPDEAYITDNTYSVWNMQSVHIAVKEWRQLTEWGSWNHYWECAVSTRYIWGTKEMHVHLGLVTTNIRNLSLISSLRWSLSWRSLINTKPRENVVPRLPPTILGMPLPTASMDALACLLSALGVETWGPTKQRQNACKMPKELRSGIFLDVFCSYLMTVVTMSHRLERIIQLLKVDNVQKMDDLGSVPPYLDHASAEGSWAERRCDLQSLDMAGWRMEMYVVLLGSEDFHSEGLVYCKVDAASYSAQETTELCHFDVTIYHFTPVKWRGFLPKKCPGLVDKRLYGDV